MEVDVRVRDDLAAVFEDRITAEAAVDELHQAGLLDEDVQLVPHTPAEHIVYEHDPDAAVTSGVVTGAVIGGLLGAIISVLLLVAVPVDAPGTIELIGLLGGALVGGYLGGFIGLAVEQRVMETQHDWEQVPVPSDGWLLVISDHGRRRRAIDVLSRHGTVLEPPRHTA